MKNLIKSVIAVMQEVKGMEKNSKVGTGKAAYDGTKDSDVKEVFNRVMAEHGLCIFPKEIEETTEVSQWQETNQYGTKQKQSVFTKVKMKYLICHESGESMEIVGYGHGIDSQDKGAIKATTYALKNALLYTFLTPVGKIEDTETTHSNQIEIPPKQTIRKLTDEEVERAISSGKIAVVLDGIKTGKFKVTKEQLKKLEDAYKFVND